MTKTTVTKRFTFEAAHHLELHRGKCNRPHGHSYKLEVAVSGTPHEHRHDDPQSGMVLDFDRLSEMVRMLIVEKLDHYDLNDSLGIYSTAENLAAYIWSYMERSLDLYDNSMGWGPLVLERVTLWETETGRVEITRGDV